MKKNGTYRLALAGMLTAAMFIIGYVESLLPAFFAVPGIKPGFANIPVMIAIHILGWKIAAAMSFTRIVLSGFTFTGLYAALFKKTGKFSVTGISIAGGAAHNTGQIIVAVLTLGKAVLYYFPVLIISGIAAGILTGIVTGVILKIFGGKLPDIY